LRYRNIPCKIWIPLILLDTPILIYDYLNAPTRNQYLFWISFVICLVLFLLSWKYIIGGGDVIFTSAILLFVQYNPLTGYPHRFFPLDFFWTLLVLSSTLPLVAFTYNKLKDHHFGLIGMFSKFPRKIPFTFVISVSFLLTTLMEMFIK
jgi:Flp pilus assembly protein protease CpaA